ncbi:MAG: hypothetical protein ACOYD1_12760 [Candidatus Nanopelagicales bacterium]
MPVVAASADQLAAMRRDADSFQAYALGPASAAVLARYAFWQELAPVTTYQAGAAELVGADVVSANHAADDAAVKFAQAVAGLNSGALELAHHLDAEQNGGPLTLGIVRAGTIPKTLGMWPLVPVIVVGAALYGGWLLVNAWLSVRAIEAQNDALRAKTSAVVTDAIARAGAQNPAAARALADAFERANNAAQNVQPGLLDKLAGIGSNVAEGLLDNSTLLLLLGGAWLWSRRKAAA